MLERNRSLQSESAALRIANTDLSGKWAQMLVRNKGWVHPHCQERLHSDQHKWEKVYSEFESNIHGSLEDDSTTGNAA